MIEYKVEVHFSTESDIESSKVLDQIVRTINNLEEWSGGKVEFEGAFGPTRIDDEGDEKVADYDVMDEVKELVKRYKRSIK